MAVTELPPPEGFSEESGSAPFTLRMLLKFAKTSNDLCRRKDGTLRRRLSDFTERKVRASEVPHHGVSTKDVVIHEGNGVWARVFLPCEEATIGKKKKPVVLHFHGGGFAVLSADFYLYDIFCRRLCRISNAVVISVNYRRAPEHRHPAAYEDCFMALEWLRSERRHGELPDEEELDLGRVFLVGDSAGANIAHHVACRAAAAPQALLPLAIAGSALLFPFFGGQDRTPSELRLAHAPIVSLDNSDWYWQSFLPVDSTRDHPSCNVFGPLAPDLSPLPVPPALVAIAEFGALKDWQLRYAQGLHRAGKQVRLLYYKGGVHSFHLFHSYMLSSQILSDLKGFISSFSYRGD